VRVLLVEDEERLAFNDRPRAATGRYGGRHRPRRQAALMKAAANSYDVIVLDRNLPVIHGDEVCRKLTERPCMARILMLTAAGSIQDRGHRTRPGRR